MEENNSTNEVQKNEVDSAKIELEEIKAELAEVKIEPKQEKQLSKGERIKRKAIWIMSIILLVEIICVSGYYAYVNFNKSGYVVTKKYNAQIAELKEIKQTKGISALNAINNNFSGWITCADADIDMPIVSTTSTSEEDYYLSHDFYKNENQCGVPYQLCNTNFATSDNVTVVGHSVFMQDDETVVIFSNLYNYIPALKVVGAEDNFDYIVKVETATKTYQYQVFSVFDFPSNQSGYEKQISIYSTKSFANETEFNTFVDNAKDLSQLDSSVTNSVTATYGDRFLTILTCKKVDLSRRVILVAKLMN